MKLKITSSVRHLGSSHEHLFPKNLKGVSKQVFLFLAMLVFSNLFAQNPTLDQQLILVNQSSVTSGIIYERVKPMSNLYEFNQNGSTHNTADYSFFEQALSELYRASNNTKLMSHTELNKKIKNDVNTKNVVNIGIINTPFQILNYNFENPSLGGLNFNANLYTQRAGKAPFYDLYAFIVAPATARILSCGKTIYQIFYK